LVSKGKRRKGEKDEKRERREVEEVTLRIYDTRVGGDEVKWDKMCVTAENEGNAREGGREGGREEEREGGREEGREGWLTVLLFHNSPGMPDVVNMSTPGVGGGAALEDDSCRIYPPQLREKHAEGLLERDGGREEGGEGRDDVLGSVMRKGENESRKGWERN